MTLLVKQANAIWLYIVPEGMRKLMNYIKQKYGNPTIIITENGNIYIYIFLETRDFGYAIFVQSLLRSRMKFVN